MDSDSNTQYTDSSISGGIQNLPIVTDLFSLGNKLSSTVQHAVFVDAKRELNAIGQEVYSWRSTTSKGKRIRNQIKVWIRELLG